jgi:hypothetical protein
MKLLNLYVVWLSIVLIGVVFTGCKDEASTTGGVLDANSSTDIWEQGDVVEPVSDGVVFPDTGVGGNKDVEEEGSDTGEGAEDVSEPVEDVTTEEDAEEPIEDISEPVEDVVACVEEPHFPSNTESVDLGGPAPNGVSPPSLVWNGMDMALFWEQNDENGDPTVYFARMAVDGSFVNEPTVLWIGAAPQRIAWTGEEYGVFYGVLEEPNSTLRFQRVDEQGALVGDPVIVATGSEGTGLYMKGMAYGDGVYTIFWNENTGYSPTYHQEFDNIGGALSSLKDVGPGVLALVGGEVEEADELVGVKDAVWTSSGVASVVRVDSSVEGPSHWLVIYDASGLAAVAHPVPVGTELDYLQEAQLHWNGTTFAVLQAGNNTNAEESSFETYFSVVDPVEGAGSSVALSGGTAVFPRMAYTGDEYGVVWQGAGAAGLHFVSVGVDGLPEEEVGVVMISDEEGTGEMLPLMGWTGDRFVVSWISYAGADVLAYNSHVLFGNPQCP